MILKKKKILLIACAVAVMATLPITASARGFDMVPSSAGSTQNGDICSPTELFAMLQSQNWQGEWQNCDNTSKNCQNQWQNCENAPQNCPNRPSLPNIPVQPDTPTPPQPPVPPTRPSVPDTGTQVHTQEVIRLVNAERAAAGFAPLTVNSKAQNAAQIRAKEQSELFSHTRPNGTSCFTALVEAGASYRTAGENIAYGQQTPQRVMEGWMNSSSHRANILSTSFTEIGVGYYEDAAGTPYWAQMFLS